MPNNKYGHQRSKVSPPHIPLAIARKMMARLTIDQVIERIEELTGQRYTRGAISAVENGHRGASPELLSALEAALDINPGDIVTDYEPNPNRRAVA